MQLEVASAQLRATKPVQMGSGVPISIVVEDFGEPFQVSLSLVTT